MRRGGERIRRFPSSQLGETAYRRPGHHFQVEYAKSNRSRCRKCGKYIPKDELRLALMLQDMEGYKSAHWTHFECFWKHRETKQALRGLHEVMGLEDVSEDDQRRVRAAYCEMLGIPDDDTADGGDGGGGGGNGGGGGSDDSDDDDGGGGGGPIHHEDNIYIATELRKKGKQVKRAKPGSRFAGKAWEKAADIIEWHLTAVDTEATAAAIHGIGTKISAEIGIILKKLARRKAKQPKVAAPAAADEDPAPASPENSDVVAAGHAPVFEEASSNANDGISPQEGPPQKRKKSAVGSRKRRTKRE